MCTYLKKKKYNLRIHNAVSIIIVRTTKDK